MPHPAQSTTKSRVAASDAHKSPRLAVAKPGRIQASMPSAISKANSSNTPRELTLGGSRRPAGGAMERAVVATCTVTAVVPDAASVTELGVSEQVGVVSAPVQVRETAPENPPSEARLNV